MLTILTQSLDHREKIRLNLKKMILNLNLLWKLLHLQPVFTKYPSYTNGLVEKLFKKGLCLPSGSDLLESDCQKNSENC